MTMVEEKSIFDTIDKAGTGNKVTAFCESLVQVFSLTKGDITEQLDKWDNETLLNLRCTLYKRLTDFIPLYKDQELIARRSKQLLIEDVYIIGFSVVNKKEDKRFKNILKGEMPSDPVLTTDAIEPRQLYETCLELREMLDIMKIRVNRNEKRINELEDENTRLKLMVCDKYAESDESHRNSHDDHGDVSEIGNQTNVIVGKQQDQTPLLKAAQHTEKPEQQSDKKAAQHTEKPEQQSDKKVDKKEEPFRHTASYRRKIVNDTAVCSCSKTDEPRKLELRGSSREQHRIKASQASVNPVSTHLVYVGQLAGNTSKDDVHGHLLDIGIENQNIADVFKLRSRSNKVSSFCISLCDAESEDIVYGSSKWPNGTRIRPFTRKHNRRDSTSHKWQPRRAPRFRKQHSKPNHPGTDWQHMSYRQSEEPSWRSQEHYDRHPAWYGDHQWSYSEQSGEYSDGSDMWNGYMDYMYSATRW